MELPSVSGEELHSWRQEAKQKAIAADVSPKEVDWLLREVAGLDALALRLESFKERSRIPLKRSLSVLKDLWNRRLQERLPVQYLLGTTTWRHFSLKVSPEVLIPRPETEQVIDIVQSALQDSPDREIASGHWVDLGTGSGAIALGLAEIMPRAEIHAVDCSEAALAIARENALNLGFSHRIEFYHGFWWAPLSAFQGRMSGMVSNPPYIPSATISRLQPEVAKHEPRLALDGGEDGLDCIRYLIDTSPIYLHSGGVWSIEMMAGQAETVARMLKENGNYCKIQTFPDLAGIERFALAYRI